MKLSLEPRAPARSDKPTVAKLSGSNLTSWHVTSSMPGHIKLGHPLRGLATFPKGEEPPCGTDGTLDVVSHACPVHHVGVRQVLHPHIEGLEDTRSSSFEQLNQVALANQPPGFGENCPR